jgi:hypothetical protein
MRKSVIIGLALMMSYIVTSPILALDPHTLDNITVFMSKAEVKTLIGEPARESAIVEGLDMELYHAEGVEPLIGAGCIYDTEEKLAAFALVFEGYLGEVIVEQLIGYGFTPRKAMEDLVLLFGLDDDTGRPVAVTVSEHDDVTTVITYDQKYYLARHTK